jgi:hypothetical protein
MLVETQIGLPKNLPGGKSAAYKKGCEISGLERETRGAGADEGAVVA